MSYHSMMVGHRQAMEIERERERRERDRINGLNDGSASGPIPENPSQTYREAYVKGLNSERKFATIALSLFAMFNFYMGMWGMHSVGEHARQREQELQGREHRIVQFYQRHGSCQSDLSSAGIDYRVQLWMNEVERKG